VLIATRAGESAFKKTFLSLPIGSRVKVQGPMGTFQLHSEADRPAVFLAGGIGITPFRSMIVERVRRNQSPHMTLLYSNRRPEDAAFLDELAQMAERNERFRLVPIMSEMGKSDRNWNGETALINGDLLKRYVEDLEKTVF
jgi:ferredoxin-NADP reductase